MKKLLFTLFSSLIMSNAAFGQVNPYVGGAYATLNEVTGNQGEVIALPGGVRVYNQSSVNQALYGTSSNVGMGMNGNVTGQVAEQSEVKTSDENTTVSQAQGMVDTNSNNNVTQDTPSGVPQTEKELEEMTKRNEQIMQNLQNRSQQFQTGASPKVAPQTKITTEKRVGQIPDINPKNRIGSISEWNTTTIDEIEAKAKEEDKQKYLNFLQSR